MQTRMQLGSTAAATMKRFLQLVVLALTLVSATAALAQQAYYIYPDHLNTPRAIEDQAMQLVWRWENRDPFGANLPDENPSGLGNFTCNLRLPGQYFDVETAYHYNYFRDYAPETGRYIQSDPIGLRGGISTYAYVYNSPLKWRDAFGQQASSDDESPLPELPEPPPAPQPGGYSKYDVCPETIGINQVCKACIDLACKIATPPCCYFEKQGCIGASGGDAAKAEECVAKYFACIGKTKKPKEPQPPNPKDI